MRYWWTSAILFLMAGVAWAQDGDAAETLSPSLATYAGLAALTTMLIGAGKKLFGDKIKGKEPLLAIGIPILLGVATKLASISFGDTDWVSHIVALALAGLGSGIIHDKIVNPLMKGTDPKN
jgi:hypothetical protein